MKAYVKVCRLNDTKETGHLCADCVDAFLCRETHMVLSIQDDEDGIFECLECGLHYDLEENTYIRNHKKDQLIYNKNGKYSEINIYSEICNVCEYEESENTYKFFQVLGMDHQDEVYVYFANKREDLYYNLKTFKLYKNSTLVINNGKHNVINNGEIAWK